jgi:hypothetical protein
MEFYGKENCYVSHRIFWILVKWYYFEYLHQIYVESAITRGLIFMTVTIITYLESVTRLNLSPNIGLYLESRISFVGWTRLG